MNLSGKLASLPGRVNKPFDIFGFIGRYGTLMVVFGAFLMTMLVPFVLMKLRPNYEVSAMLKIDPVIPSLITKSDDPSITGYYREYVKTQSILIKEYTILKEAIERLSPQEAAALFPPEVPQETRISLLKVWLQVVPVSRSHLIQLSIQHPNRHALAPILNRLMEVYVESMQKGLAQKDERRLDYLKEKIKTLQGDISAKEKQIESLAKQVMSGSFTENDNLWLDRLRAIQNAYVENYKARVVAENAYRYGNKAAAEKRQVSLDPLVEEGLMNNQAINYTESWTYQQLQEMRKSIDGITAENQDRIRVEERMEAMRDYEKTLRKETRNNIAQMTEGKRELELKQEQIDLKKNFEQIQATEKDLLNELSQTMEKSSENSARILQGQALASGLEHDRQLLFTLDTRIHELEIESRAPLRVNIETMARPPKTAAGSNIKKLLMLCFVLSFGSVGSLFLLIELSDNRIHSSKSIIQALSCPPTWPIAQLPKGVSFAQVLDKAPESATAKALRSLAIRLFREQQENNAKVFLFSGVDNGNGTSSIAANVAYSLISQSDKGLLIDANLQDWDLLDLAELELEDPQKESAPLPTTASLIDCIQRDEEKGYDTLIPFIPRRSNRATSRLLGSLLHEVQAHYDFIVIDAAPVLQNDLTEYLAVNSDIVVLVSQGSSTKYRDLRRAAEIFVRLDVPALTPVLNWGGTRRIPTYEQYVDKISGHLLRLTERLSISGRFFRNHKS